MPTQRRRIEVTPDSLLGCRFFDRLERADRAHIVRFCEGRCYEAGTEIIRHGDSTKDVFFILSGLVQASLFTSKGGTVTFQDLTEGEMFGELAALDGGPRSTSVVTKEETCVIRISGPNFKDMVSRFPALSELTMLRLCSLSRFLTERAFTSRALSIPEQIHYEIFRIVSSQVADRNGSVTIEKPPTHEAVARYVGTNREQVTRAMGMLTKAKLVTLSGKSWVVKDVSAFREFLPQG